MSALEPDDPHSVGTYRLLSRLGAGGMGRVYLGRSPGGRLVAVKVVHSELVRRPEFRDRFRREVEAARKVSGAFTAPVVDADPDAPLPWLVTSYIAGPSLEQAVAERGPFEAGAVLALAAGLAEALVSIHAAHLVHRDLKPSNVLLAEDGPRVIDFGIVRSVDSDSVTRTGQVAGSPGFMSPEQVNGEDVTPASDVFCLGAVLAFAATGANPFGGGPTPALLYRVVHNPPDVQAVTDPALRALIGDCLAKDPAGRPTPHEILARVGALGNESTMALRHPGPWPPGNGPATPAASATPLPAGRPTDPAAATGVLPRDGGPGAFPHQATMVAPRFHDQATRVGAAPEPAPGTTEPAGTGGPGGRRAARDAARERGGSRRAFLLLGAGAGTVAAAGVGAGFWLNRSSAADRDRATPPSSARPSSTPSAAPQPVPPVGHWPLTETSGTLARDTSGGHDGTATGVTWLPGGGGAVFDGRSSQIMTAGPVLRTGEGRSFTVAAWVRLSAAPGNWATAVSQDAGDASSFYLQYAVTENRWAFSRPGLRATGRSEPAVNVWTHLTGVCDGPARRLRLYVNGALEVAVEDTNPQSGTGPFIIGRASYGGRAVDFFPGAVRDVRIFDRALAPARIKKLG
ncbi:protein kinase domain-containing protein [Streptomyces capillispiralis]|uniref:Serine/threonine protein kinase n=1 Tax=Streptomyces capillispiralis TaxID=68182 RepID=A0A561TFT2_9ACTN|nr:LamG-like jellyroll fold domain-containing protein [Streptomyces capillispiralis]TWF85976.1 serine/threonine protein kinase [Streptomyces capillispiralis]GHH89446.1 protein kinase [Streptomyces capillispiralis]